MTPKQVDVLVIGAGGSGLAAAVSCGEQGFETLVLESCQQPGGTTGIAVGSFTAAETSHQQFAGIVDSAAQHANDLAQFAPDEIEQKNNPTSREFFSRHTADTLDWLESHGLRFVGPVAEPPNRQPRMHNVIPGAKAYIARLQLAARKQGVVIQTQSTVNRLLIEDGRVVGTQYENHLGQTQQVLTRVGVILATGDYANNQELIRRFKGDGYENIEGINPHARGLGHILAEQAGAKLLNMDVTYGPELRFVATAKRPFQQWLPVTGPLAALQSWLARRLPDWIFRKLIKRLLVTWQHPEAALFDDGCILVNQQGLRFCDERSEKDRNIGVSQQPDRQAYILMSPTQIAQYSQWPHFISTAPDIAYAYVEDYLRLRPDISHQASSLEQIATHYRLPLAELHQTAVDAFGQATNGPWVMLGPVKSYFTTTEGGAKINEHFQVVNEEDELIDGLFAVGQCGLNGMILWSHGCHIAWAMTSGRLVGQALRALADQTMDTKKREVPNSTSR